MASQPSQYQAFLTAILDWVAAKRAQGSDAYAMSSANGNQGLDALLAQRGITLPEFNQGAQELGIAFTQGTTWLRSYAGALQSTLGLPLTPPGGGQVAITSGGGPSMSDLLLYGGLGLAAVLVLPKLLRRR